MNTPICDFVRQYAEKDAVRLHMPGHKGCERLGNERFDITEIDGADELFTPTGIIAESERNASHLFGAETLYSAGGSTLCIQAMLYLISQYAAERKETARILAARNAHRAFVNAAALLGIDVEWFYPTCGTYYSCDIDVSRLESKIREVRPTAVYVTSPDYLGNIADIAALSRICRSEGVLFAVDCAHGAYLKLLPESLYPTDLGADICVSSAHKTLPVLTGGAYLNISGGAPRIFSERAKAAFSLFSSSSPSYLILQSLDLMNARAEEMRAQLCRAFEPIERLKAELSAFGYGQMSDEVLKISLETKSIGYTGCEIGDILKASNIYPELCDKDFVVLMLSPQNIEKETAALRHALLSVERREKICVSPPDIPIPKVVTSPREALLSPSECVASSEALGRVFASSSIGCPPAIPLVVCGEEIDEAVLKSFEYYGIENVRCCTGI